MSRPAPDTPIFLIIAGPNGSGKSSLYRDAIIQRSERSFWIINPDELAAHIAEYEHSAQANLEAVIRIQAWLETSIRAYQTVGVETVLSTGKYRRLVQLAKQFGFQTKLLYVILESPQHCVRRVKMRVEKGGHSVPEEKIIERYSRSLAQLPWFLGAADSAAIYDNSGSEPKIIAEKHAGVVTVDPDALPVIKEAARAIQI